jgi:glucose/arabinose dehydrogenase
MCETHFMAKREYILFKMGRGEERKRGISLLLFSFCVFCASVVQSVPAHAQTLPPCGERPTLFNVFEPWIDSQYFCLEMVIRDERGAGELAYTALAVGDDGTLYAAQPLTGSVITFDDSDGDLLPDSPRTLIAGLTLPNALVWHDGALYIAGGANVYRWRAGELETLIDSVPSGAGFWTSALAVGDDGVIYVATGTDAPDDQPPSEGRGAVLRYADGAMAIIAQGLRQPGDLAWYHGDLWTSDTAPDALGELPNLDEINRLLPNADFGFPACVGVGGCLSTLPAYRLPTHSTPLGMAAYTGGALPVLDGALLVVLAGNGNAASLRGYEVRALWFDDDGLFLREYSLLPNDDSYTQGTGQTFSQQELSYRGSGIYPRRPLDVAVSPQGWLYISVQGGLIMAVREP